MAVGSKTRLRLATRLGLRSSGLPMTAEEFDELSDHVFTDHLRYELIHGVLIVTPPPGNGEVAPSSELGHLIWYYQHHHPQGSIVDEVLAEQTIYSTFNRRRADHAIWTGLGRIPDVAKDVPSILVEFVSASKRDFGRDYVTKRAEYLGIGVREYWIIDRFQRIMTVYRNRPEGVETLVIKEAESHQTDLLPGFSLPLAGLLARADDWPGKRRDSPRKTPPEGGPG